MKQTLSLQELENIQKKKVGQYLKMALIVTAGVLAVLLVLLYGRIDITLSILTPDVADPVADSIFAPDVAESAVETTQGQQPEAELRAQFKEKMHFYQNEVKPRISMLHLFNWAEQEQEELETGEREAIVAFANGEFSSAIARIDRLGAKVSGLQKRHEENFLVAVEEAEQAFEARHFERALDAVDRALRYKPEDAVVLQLKSRIAVMREVDALVRSADVARAENRPDKEIALLERALGLDPARAELVEKHRLLISQRNERSFATFLKRSWVALEKKDVGKAKANFARAARLFPDRKELTLLSKKIKRIDMELAYRRAIERARADESNDNWTGAETNYTKALSIFPNDKQSKVGLDRARFINRQIRGLEKNLLLPERLSDPDIVSVAKKLIDESEKEAARSLKLRQLISQLSEAIQIASVPVPVTVYSDGKTQISVLGVGVIGKVLEYSLKQGLKLGSYTFKGERKGFRDKLVKVQVRHGKAVKVTVICDELV